MAKFKVGDKVRCVSYGEEADDGDNPDFVGEIGEVTTVNVGPDQEWPYRVSFPSSPDNSGGPLCYEHELELVEDTPVSKGYVYYSEWDASYRVRRNLSDVPDDALWVWELGDELVKTVKWEKKDA
jgi:hypothetical protein